MIFSYLSKYEQRCYYWCWWDVVGARGVSKGVRKLANKRDYNNKCSPRGDGQPNFNRGVNEFISSGNPSETLMASLYVPKNNKLVKIDGELINCSILSNKKALTSYYRNLAPSILGSIPIMTTILLMENKLSALVIKRKQSQLSSNGSFKALLVSVNKLHQSKKEIVKDIIYIPNGKTIQVDTNSTSLSACQYLIVHVPNYFYTHGCIYI